MILSSNGSGEMSHIHIESDSYEEWNAWLLGGHTQGMTSSPFWGVTWVVGIIIPLYMMIAWVEKFK